MNEHSETWQPTASLESLRQRAHLLRLIRAFFHARNVLEVDTPLLCGSTATDPYLASLAVLNGDNNGNTKSYLQTSPEFCMKRLLAAGSGCIYQLGKVFRQDEVGRNHNPEFTMLEWYRVGFSLPQLMDETTELVLSLHQAISPQPAPTISHFCYLELFTTHLGLNPHQCKTADLQVCVANHINTYTNSQSPDLERDDCLNLLMSHVIEPKLPRGLVYITEFPIDQAALAVRTTNSNGDSVAARTELYWDGLELANGYQELTNAVELRARFTADINRRVQLGLPELPMPEHLLQAMASGLPECSGIALGVDRLLMRLLAKTHIEETISFPSIHA